MDAMDRTAKVALLTCTLAAAGLLAACGSDHASIRFVHAAVSAPSSPVVALDIAVDGKSVASSVPYQGVFPSSDYQSFAAGGRHVEMSTAGTTDDLINTTIPFAAGRHYTLCAIGFQPLPDGASSNFGIAAALLTDDNSAPPAGNIKIRILHAAPLDGIDPNGVNLDIYIVPPGTDITTVSPSVPNLPYGQASGYQSVPATSNQVIFTVAGSKSAVITQTYPLSAGQIRTLIAVNLQNGTGLSPTPIVLADAN